MSKVGPHGNTIEVNDTPYHLYLIYDNHLSRIYKFGVCGGPIRKNGNSPRLTRQVNLFNTIEDVNERFSGRILLRDIKGIIRAYILEDDFVDLFRSKNDDKLPNGNFNHPYLGRKYTYLLIEAGEEI